jgi:hypothetical protein
MKNLNQGGRALNKCLTFQQGFIPFRGNHYVALIATYALKYIISYQRGSGGLGVQKKFKFSFILGVKKSQIPLHFPLWFTASVFQMKNLNQGGRALNKCLTFQQGFFPL